MLLPERERSIAGYVDHLPEGAAMDIKSLAKSLPLYGQMAVGTALKALGVAGHLRYVRCRGGEGDQVRWVTLTFWSRTARDNEWWDAFLEAENRRGAAPQVGVVTGADPVAVPAEVAEVAAPEAPFVPQQRSHEPVSEGPSPAYLALARLGRAEPRLALSAADCSALEGLAAQWFVRGVDADYLTHALTSGLPERVGSPVGFVRRRLTDKMPPHLPAAAPASSVPDAAVPGAAGRRVLVECAECRAPGPSEALRDGLCRPCRRPAAAAAAPAPDVPVERDVRAHVSHLRELLKMP